MSDKEWKDRAIKAAIVETGDTYHTEWETDPAKLIHDVMCFEQRVATDPSVNGGFKLTPASPPWPPTWGEGIPCGWCKAKNAEAAHVWAWTTDGRIQVGRPGYRDTVSVDVFRRDFEPL